MEPANTLPNLEKCEETAFAVEEIARSARTFKTSALRVARFARRVCNMIYLHCDLGENHDNSGQLKPDFKPIYEALLSAKNIVIGCSKHHSVIGFLKANQLKQQFLQWPQLVQESLLSFQNSNEITDQALREEFDKELGFLMGQIATSSFTDEEMEQTCSVLKSFEASLEALTKSSEYITLVHQLEELGKEMNFSVLDLVELQEIYAGKDEWLGKDEVQEGRLVLMQMALSKVLRNKTNTFNCNFNLIPDLPLSFRCPISMDLMTDPVVLAESGQIYDKQSISRWFATGKSTCPITGKRIVSTQLIPVHSLKSDIVEFAKKYNINSEKTGVQSAIREKASTDLTINSQGFVLGSSAFILSPQPPEPIFPPLDSSIFETRSTGTLAHEFRPPPYFLVPELNENDVVFVNVTGEPSLQHMSPDQLRYNDYCLNGYQGLSIAALPEGMRHPLPVNSQVRHFSTGTRLTVKRSETEENRQGEASQTAIGSSPLVNLQTTSSVVGQSSNLYQFGTQTVPQETFQSQAERGGFSFGAKAPTQTEANTVPTVGQTSTAQGRKQSRSAIRTRRQKTPPPGNSQERETQSQDKEPNPTSHASEEEQ